MKKTMRTLLLATALASVGYSAAFAEVVYNRGNSADPESLDPHKTSTVYEAHILRDLTGVIEGEPEPRWPRTHCVTSTPPSRPRKPQATTGSTTPSVPNCTTGGGTPTW
jgi:hypothetical protein